MIEKGVWKKKKARIEMNNHPINPAKSAANRFQRSKINMSIIGERANRINRRFINSPASY